MQTNLTQSLRNSRTGKEAEAILRSCVHCGFCNATCPTYQLLGDELDGPRGRIYQIKEVLEGHRPSAITRQHLDRCLTCRACETTCPSGVEYGRLLDIGRAVVERQLVRGPGERLLRWLLRKVLPYPTRFTPLLRLGQSFRPLLPAGLARRIPMRRKGGSQPVSQHQRRMILMAGCVQPALAPDINGATARVLDRLGIRVLNAASAGCCGALSHHLNAHEEARHYARRNIDAWWPLVEDGAEAIIITASGCATQVKDYAQLLAHDSSYAAKAERISRLTRDISEVLAAEDISPLQPDTRAPVAFHSSCTLQHGQSLGGIVEGLLGRLGFTLTPVAEAHLCCGSAGTYSILQGELSRRLQTRKLEHLQAGSPARIATANIGCLLQLQAGTDVPVCHWIQLLDPGE